MRAEGNLNLPFEKPKSGRTPEQIEQAMLKKYQEGKTKEFDSEEAEAYADMLRKDREDRAQEGKGGLYGQQL